MSNPIKYEREFYQERHARTVHSASTILGELVSRAPSIKSAVDVGCGVGTWLHHLTTLGITDVIGVDGPWVPPDTRMISGDRFIANNLGEPLHLARRFDLAISLEVAEHLQPVRAEDFVGSLCGLSDLILFSAAVPGQGGLGHVNEQWPKYWHRLFRQRGYDCLDGLRAQIWDDAEIPYWYRQNILVFVNSSKPSALVNINGWTNGAPLALVHPDLFNQILERQLYPASTLRLLGTALRRYGERRIPLLS